MTYNGESGRDIPLKQKCRKQHKDSRFTSCCLLLNFRGMLNYMIKTFVNTFNDKLNKVLKK